MTSTARIDPRTKVIAAAAEQRYVEFDLHDRVDLIPFTTLTQFFQDHLNEWAGTSKAHQHYE